MRKIGLSSVGFAIVVACSNSSGNGDGGTDGSAETGSDSGNTVAQTGQIIDFDNKTGVFDIMVSGAGNTTTTDSMGNYSLAVPPNTPYTMQVVAGADAGKPYVSLNEQEWMLTGAANRGQTSFVSAGTEGLLKSVLPTTPNPMLAVLSVIVEATGSCAADAGGADVTGATISVPGLPSGDAGSDGGPNSVVLVYFSGGLPSGSATSVTAGQLPSALIYNLPTTTSFNQITVTHPTCHMKAFPVSDSTSPNIVYTGNVRLDPSEPTNGPGVVSNIRVFLD